MEAPWPDPPRDGATLWAISDTHITVPTTDTYPWSLDHMTEAVRDVDQHAEQWNVIGKVHCGDITNDGSAFAGQDAAALDWLTTHMNTPTDVWMIGNHDFPKARYPTQYRTRGAWESVYGRSANTSTYMGPADARIRVLAMSPDEFDYMTGGFDSWWLTQATIDWLDSALAADPITPTWLACHYPLRQQPDEPSGSKTQPENQIEALIAAHPHAIGWLSGHSHWAVDYSLSVITRPVANRAAFPMISCPSTALYPPGRASFSSGICTLLVTYLDADRIEVRFRGDGSRKWITGNNGERVVVLSPA